MCPKHGTDYLEYKCRYCCSVAVFFCFGTTHFCNACHDDFQRVANIPKAELPQCPVAPKVHKFRNIQRLTANIESSGCSSWPWWVSSPCEASRYWRRVCPGLWSLSQRSHILDRCNQDVSCISQCIYFCDLNFNSSTVYSCASPGWKLLYLTSLFNRIPK